MSRGRRGVPSRPGRELDADGWDPMPTRIWVTGCLNIAPGPRGGVRVSDELDGLRSMFWIERGYLTLPLPLDPFADTRMEIWRAPAGQSLTPEQASKQIGPALVSGVREVARELWTPVI